MTKRTKQVIIDCIAAAVLIFGGTLCVADLAPAVLHIGQYLFNAIYFLLILPAAVAVTDITEWAHPEYFTKDELAKKGR